MIVFRQRFTGGFALGIFQRHRNQFFLQTSFFVGRVRSLLRAQGKLILHLARDALLRAIKLRGIRHVEAAIAVEQRDHQRIFQLAAGSEIEAIAAANGEWSLRHRFHAAGQNQIRLAQLDHLRGIDDGLNTAATKPIHGERRRLYREDLRAGPHAARRK